MLRKLNQYTLLPNSTMVGDTFSPTRILLQIILLQCFYYITASVLFSLTASLCGYEFTFDWIFSYKLVSFQNTLGWTLFCLWLFDSLLCVLFMTIIVGRSKLAWDFAVTVHVINFIVCWVYTGDIPNEVLWWFLQVMSSCLLVGLGTYSTRWRELRDTFFEDMADAAELGGIEHLRARRGEYEMDDLGTNSGVANVNK